MTLWVSLDNFVTEGLPEPWLQDFCGSHNQPESFLSRKIDEGDNGLDQKTRKERDSNKT